MFRYPFSHPLLSILFLIMETGVVKTISSRSTASPALELFDGFTWPSWAHPISKQELIYLQKGHYCPPGYYNNESMDVYNKDVSWYSKSCIDQFMVKRVRSYNAFTNLSLVLYLNRKILLKR